ncbi:MAG: hypothetical protein HYS07_11225 [Chlamydiae bacterium]|nr:hypothetical protein [Chlamydiota bacterium]MBI3278193.1 hypothetical protein [Chlamydiota bacterium]
MRDPETARSLTKGLLPEPSTMRADLKTMSTGFMGVTFLI